MQKRPEKPVKLVTYPRQIWELNIRFAKLGIEECEICDEHHAKFHEMRSAYKENKNLFGKCKGVVFVSGYAKDYSIAEITWLQGVRLYKTACRDKSILCSLAVVWHEGISGRNDEDVTSAFLKSMNSVEFSDVAR